MLKRVAKQKDNLNSYQFWQHHSNPIELWSEKVIKQKISYIHYNPVESGFVNQPSDWKYSSASNYEDMSGIIEIDDPGFINLDK